MQSPPLITNDAVVCGIILCILALVFSTKSHPYFQRFYTYIPPIVLCYFIPAALSHWNIISSSHSRLYFIATRYFLPASLVLLMLPVDLRALFRLGSRTLLMFFAAMMGVVIGGPIALLFALKFLPGLFISYTPLEMAHALSTLAGSWIGGGANQAAMKEIFGVSDKLFGIVLLADILVGNMLLVVLLWGSGHRKRINRWLHAGEDSMKKMAQVVESHTPVIPKPFQLRGFFLMAAVGMGLTAIGHLAADGIVPWVQAQFPWAERMSFTNKFFWIVVVSSLLALLLSLTPMRKMEKYGTSELGSAFLYFLIATIGMGIDLSAIASHSEIIWLGLCWIGVHIGLLILFGRLFRLPYFFLAVASQANVGGAASAPVVAAAFHPKLIPVGVLLAVLGYAIGTYAAYACALLMQWVVT